MGYEPKMGGEKPVFDKGWEREKKNGEKSWGKKKGCKLLNERSSHETKDGGTKARGWGRPSYFISLRK